MGTRGRDENLEEDAMQGRKRSRGGGTAATLMRLGMGAAGGGPSMVAEGQSESAQQTRAAVQRKIPKFFAWLASLSDEHDYAAAKIFVPASRDWTHLSTDQMMDRR
jgi:hypothetical protein